MNILTPAQNEEFNAKVFITSAYPDPEPLSTFLNYVKLDKVKRHTIVADPSAADIILFIENSRYHDDYFFRKLKNNRLVREYSSKVFMYNPHDKPWFVLPGLYPSVSKPLYNSNCIVSSPYIETINPYIKYDVFQEPDLLFSFVGSPNSSPRRKILKLNHTRALVQASHNVMFGTIDQTKAKVHYAEILAKSKFILCPRGAGASSYRLFEAMQSGRVPVIISDDWVCPKGPKWEEFALFIPESDIDNIPRLLEKEELNWPDKSKLARKAWESFFAPEVTFNYFIDNILALKMSYNIGNYFFRVRHYAAAHKYLFRIYVIQNVKLIISKMKQRNL